MSRYSRKTADGVLRLASSSSSRVVSRRRHRVASLVHDDTSFTVVVVLHRPRRATTDKVHRIVNDRRGEGGLCTDRTRGCRTRMDLSIVDGD